VILDECFERNGSKLLTCIRLINIRDIPCGGSLQRFRDMTRSAGIQVIDVEVFQRAVEKVVHLESSGL
jgi:hypothetical protein